MKYEIRITFLDFYPDKPFSFRLKMRMPQSCQILLQKVKQKSNASEMLGVKNNKVGIKSH